MIRQRIATAAIALLIVLTAVTGAMSGSVAADDHTGWQDCSFSDSLIGAVWNTVTGADSGCRWAAGTASDYEGMIEIDAYANMAAAADSAYSFTTQTDNLLTDARSVAWTEAQIAAIQVWNDGGTDQDALNASEDAVDDYYALIEQNVINDWNAKNTQAMYAETESDIQMSIYDGTTGRDLGDWFRTTHSLVNGSEVWVQGPEEGGDFVSPLSSGPNPADDWEIYNESANEWEDTTMDPDEQNLYWLRVHHPDEPALHPWGTGDGHYKPLTSEIRSQRSQVRDNIETFISTLASEYEAGEIEEEIVDSNPLLLAERAATDYNTTGHHSFAAVQLAAMGGAGNVSHSADIALENGTTWTGTPFVIGDDPSSLQVGQQYVPEDYSGSVWIAEEDAGLQPIEQNFTVSSLTDTRRNESISETGTEEYVYKESNTSRLADAMGAIADLRDELENEEARFGLGGGLFGNLLGGIGGAVALLVVGAVVVLALRFSSDDS